MANDDKIYLAYSGELGEKSAINARRRIEWILKSIDDAETILDIGCSQGIVSILAAEGGKKVKGIDIQIESVDFAQKLLESRYQHLSEFVTFECTDFMEYTGTEQYDCIIMTEVLEHLENPSAFLEKAQKNLKQDGKMIITVPFGFAPHLDHKTTFYLTNFVTLIEKFFSISNIEYMERWMGACCNLQNEKKFVITKEQVENLEKNFALLDVSMSYRIKDLYQKSTNMNIKYKEIKENMNNVLHEKKEKEHELKNALQRIKEKDKMIQSLEWEASQYRKIRYSFVGRISAKILHLFRKLK